MVNDGALRGLVAAQVRAAAAKRWLAGRVDVADERGDVSSTVVVIALLVAAATVVLGLIVANLTTRANNIPTS